MRRPLPLLLFLFALTFSSHAETFKNPQRILTGSAPNQVVEGDVNGDGRPDLIYSDLISSGANYTTIMHVLLNQGSDQYSAGQDISFPANYSGAFTLADVNGDGKLDLVLAPTSGIQAELAVALGNGDGTFQPLVVSTLPAYSNSVFALIRSLTVADLNGDGAPDLIFTDIQYGMIGICFGDKTGHFNLVTQIRDYNEPSQVFLNDYNGDGKTDFIVHDSLSASATVYLNNGDGTFATGVNYTGPDHIGSMSVKDMDGDGHPDMVITDSDNNLQILHGNSDGTFTATVSAPVNVGSASMHPTVLDVDDYNHDGVLDLALVSTDGVHILLGQGSFTFNPLSPAPVGSTYLGFYKPAIGDLNSDGNIDIVFPYSEGLAILYGKADGSLSSADAYDMRHNVASAVLADFNGDKKTDVAVAVDAPNLRVLIGKGDGTFTLLPDTNTSSTSGLVNGSVTSGDFNGDGRADVLITARNSTTDESGTLFQLGNGDGTFGPLTSLSSSYRAFAAGGTVGDLNNDERSDIMQPDGTYGNEYQFFLGQTNGSFRESGTITPNVAAQFASAFVYGDFNKDGKLDVANIGYGTLQVFNGNGDGTLSPGFQFSNIPGGNNWGVFDAVAVDLDGDGNLDIAAPAGLSVEIFYGHGDGTFDAPVYIPYTLPQGAEGHCCAEFINAADFNRDGKMDVVLSYESSFASVISVLHGAGNKSFDDQVDYLAGDAPTKPLIADLNGDGYPDIVVANNDGNGASTVTVLLNIPDNGDVLGNLTATPEPSDFGSPFTLHLNLSAAVAGAGTPTGTVTFSVDGTTVGTVPLTSGSASFVDTSSVAAGTHAISALYSGNSVFHGSTFSGEHTVVAVTTPTQTTLQVNPNPADAGVTVTFTAQVMSSGAVPNGTVTFQDGSTSLGTGSVGRGGPASFSTSSLLPGTHVITAVYGGNATYGPSTSNAVNLVVQGDPTTTALTSTPNPVNAGQSLAFTATVTSHEGVPSGAVSFVEGTTPLGIGSVNASGTAAFATSSLAPGTHSVTAVYAGNQTYDGSTSPALSVIVDEGPSTTTLAATPNPAAVGNSVTLQASISSLVAPTGTVSFLDGNHVIGQAALNANGTATYSTTYLAVGMHTMTASYSGNTSVLPSLSVAVQEVIVPFVGDFTIAALPQSTSVYTGAATRFHLFVSPTGGFDQTVVLSCAGLPAETTCSFDPGSMAAGKGPSVVVIQTSAPHQTRTANNSTPFSWTTTGSGLLASLAFLFFPRRSRKRGAAFMLALGIFLLMNTLACGSPGPVGGGTLPGTYSISIVGTASGQGEILSHSADVKLTVKTFF